VILRAARDAGPPSSALRVLLSAAAFLPLAIFGMLAFFAPLAFEVNSDAVVVKRLGKDVVVPFERIRGIRRVEPGEVRRTWRLCGCGGFLGWFGLFYSRKLGRFWAYAGNQKDLVLLTQTDGTKIVITTLQKFPFVLRGLLHAAGAETQEKATAEEKAQAKAWESEIAK